MSYRDGNIIDVDDRREVTCLCSHESSNIVAHQHHVAVHHSRTPKKLVPKGNNKFLEVDKG